MNSLKDSKSFTEAMLISSVIAYVTFGVGILAFYLYEFKEVDSAMLGAWFLIPISIMFFGFLTFVYYPRVGTPRLFLKTPLVKKIDYKIETILDTIVFLFFLLPMIMFSIPILLINLHIIKKSEKLEKTTKNRKL